MITERALICAALVASANASAQTTLVIESAVDQEPPEVDTYLAEVVKGLGPARSGPSLGADLDAHFGPAPARLSSGAVAELAARLKKSERSLFLSGTHTREAIDDLEDVRGRLAAALFALAHSPEARTLYLNVLLKLARAYQINGRGAEAEKRMLEVVRYFHDSPPDPTKIENELASLLAKCQAELPAGASLRVTGGRLCANGNCAAGSTLNLPAGDYRFFVSTARGDGRVHSVTLAPGQHKLFSPDVELEVSLRTDSFVGFVFGGPAQRDRSLATFAATLAAELGAGAVAVLGEAHLGGKRHLALSLYGSDRALIAAVATPGAPGVLPAEQARRVAERLRLEQAAARGKATRPTPEQDQSAALVILTPAKTVPVRARLETPHAAAPQRDRARSHALELSSWVFAAVGFPLALAGSYYYAREYLGTCDSPIHLCPRSYDQALTSKLGFAALTAGEGLMGIGLLVGWLDAERPLRDLGIHFALDGAALLVSGGLQYQTAHYPIRFDRQANGAIVETTPESTHAQGRWAIAQMSIGAVLVAGGTALALADRYLLQRRNPPFTLSVAVGTSGAGLSVTHHF